MNKPISTEHPPTAVATVAIRRRLTPQQARRRTQLIEAARHLANDGGYEAVSIDAVCAAAGVARGTLYHYFGSKDQLLAHAVVLWAGQLGAELRSSPPLGDSVATRIGESFGQVFGGVAREPRFFRAALQALFASDPGVNQMQKQLSAVAMNLLDAVVGNSTGVHSASLCMVLGHVLHSLVVGMASGRVSPEMAMADITQAARLLLDPPAGQRRQQLRTTKIS